MIVAIGDSITYGFPFGPEKSWVRIASEKIGVSLLNRGVCGDLTSDILERLARDALAHKPRGVIVMGGINDVYAGLSADDIFENLRMICASIRDAGSYAALGEPTPVNDAGPAKELFRLRSMLEMYAAENQIPYIRFFRALANDAGFFKPGLHVDGVHPSIRGYETMANVLVIDPTLKRWCSQENPKTRSL